MHHIDRDKLIFLNSKLNLVALKFNLGGPMAQYQMVVQELLMLACTAGTCMELKLNIGSYCGLLWSIFGDQCN